MFFCCYEAFKEVMRAQSYRPIDSCFLIHLFYTCISKIRHHLGIEQKKTHVRPQEFKCSFNIGHSIHNLPLGFLTSLSLDLEHSCACSHTNVVSSIFFFKISQDKGIILCPVTPPHMQCCSLSFPGDDWLWITGSAAVQG